MENVQRFYIWLQKMGNIHLNDNDQMVRAFDKIHRY
jgi:hypothetical protein